MARASSCHFSVKCPDFLSINANTDLIAYVECKYQRQKARGGVSPMMLEPIFIDVFHKSWIVNEDLGKIGEKDSLIKYPGEKNKQQTTNQQ